MSSLPDSVIVWRRSLPTGLTVDGGWFEPSSYSNLSLSPVSVHFALPMGVIAVPSFRNSTVALQSSPIALHLPTRKSGVTEPTAAARELLATLAASDWTMALAGAASAVALTLSFAAGA